MIAETDGDGRTLNAMSVDVEDYFHVTVFRRGVRRDEWGTLESRVERNVDALLALFGETGVRATFFCLGEVARTHPGVVRRIAAAGHEVASHGMSHEKLDALDRAAARAEIFDSKALLEDLAGREVLGFRAPSFSVVRGTLWALDDLLDAGYRYDSSIFPIGRPDYGIADARREPHRLAAPSGRELPEFPLTVAEVFGRAVPVSGGGYFRLLPYVVTRWGFRNANDAGRPGIFYLHPWEIDPGQPDLRARLSRLGAFRHYTGLGRTAEKLRRLLTAFRFDTAAEVLRRRGLLAG
ncbi:MAG TPA: XrtA system polysaccharide deacetylase [Planctomycetota bacterium]|nr:XrtA system polysaccharide deacetylase [Planctomycetota bacterium]